MLLGRDNDKIRTGSSALKGGILASATSLRASGGLVPPTGGARLADVDLEGFAACAYLTVAVSVLLG
jgi:hypothetical protein